MPVVAPSGPSNASIMIVGEAPGAEEEAQGIPFIGGSGQLLNQLCREAGFSRDDCFVTNLCKERPPCNNIDLWFAKSKKQATPEHIPLFDKLVLPPIFRGHQALEEEISGVRPKAILALGNKALWALTSGGAEGITKWRGSQLSTKEGIPLIPTYHPAAILRQHSWRVDAVADIRRLWRGVQKGFPAKPAWEITIRPSLEEALLRLSLLATRMAQGESLWLELDIETKVNHIACLGLSWSRSEAIVIPFLLADGAYWQEGEEVEVVHALRAVLTHQNARVRWQNGLFDAQYLERYWGFVPNAHQDTMITHHTLAPSLSKALHYQASLYCDHYVYWKDDGKIWGKGVSEEALWRYNAEDCFRTREVGEKTSREATRIAEQEQFQQKMFWPVLAAMIRGIRSDLDAKRELVKQLKGEITHREMLIEQVLGHPLNPSSKTQMQALFYHDLQQKHIYRVTLVGGKRTYSLTTDDDALTTIGKREPLLRQLCNWIKEWRSLRVYLRTFAELKLDTDGRIRCSFNICGTNTFRLASSKNAFGSGTNLQNIPAGGLDERTGLTLPNMRKMFAPDPGYCYFDLDLSKADLRVVAWEAEEREMMAMLEEGRDPYVETAREFYHDPSITKTLSNGESHPRYRTFKSFAHGTHYLGTPEGIALNLGLTVQEAKRTQDWYFGKFPRIKTWQENFKRRFFTTGTVENAWGYRFKFIDRLTEETLKEAIAWLPQSTVAIYINHIWLEVFKQRPSVEVLAQGHDSLSGQIKADSLELELAAIKKIASSIFVPYPNRPLMIPVNVKTSPESWGACG